MRKTFDIESLRTHANLMLLNLPDEQVDARHAVINLLTQTLHDAGSYAGFSYLDAKDMEKSASGTTLGINGTVLSNMGHTERFAGTDETRVHYF